MPTPGDAAICIQCGNVSIFDDDLSLRKPLPEEEPAIQEDQTIRETQRAVFETRVIIEQRRNKFH